MEYPTPTLGGDITQNISTSILEVDCGLAFRLLVVVILTDCIVLYI
jgi:hypothetical protein